MLISYNWLKEYIDLKLDPIGLADRLNLSGLPVEEVKEINSGVTGVVTAKILNVEKHPNADNLSICDVTDGKEQLKIVCGAKNIAPGQIVPLAKEGASLPGGIKIKKTKIRNIESSGMLCSSKELGIDNAHEGILILDPAKYRPGMDFTPYAPDTVLSLEITPNRPDLLCITGVARFIASITGDTVKYPDCEIKKEYIDTTLDIHARLKVDNRSGSRCPRYSARIIDGVVISESPAWLKDRLIAMGIHPVNNVVDVTNYVMFELNQPLHAFDCKKISNGNIIVRTAVKHEKITALDGKTYELKDTDLIIADTKEPIAIAGVMGGEYSSIGPATTTIVLESAFFSPQTVRKTSRTLGLSSDSSYRFERGIDIQNVEKALNRAAGLIIQVAGGMCSRNIIDVYPEKRASSGIILRNERINRLLGTSLNDSDISSFIKKLNFTVISQKPGILTVETPSYRPDLQQEVDLIEDIAQVYGYDKIPITLPTASMSVGSQPAVEYFINDLYSLMTGYGFSEVKNYSFLNNRLQKELNEESFSPGDAVSLKNPFNEEESKLKTTLIPDLIKNLITNRNNENENIHLFECANVFTKTTEGYVQTRMLSGVTCGYVLKPSYNHKELLSDFNFLKSVINDIISMLKSGNTLTYEPGSGQPFYEFHADLNINGVNIGKAGQLKHDVLYANKFKDKAFVFEINISTLFKLKSSRFQYSKITRFPVVKRDLSIIVDAGIPSSKIEEVIKSVPGNLVKSLDLYDLYRGDQVPEGSKSLTYSIVFQSEIKTLSDEDINKEMTGIIQKLKADVNAGLRS